MMLRVLLFLTACFMMFPRIFVLKTWGFLENSNLGIFQLPVGFGPMVAPTSIWHFRSYLHKRVVSLLLNWNARPAEAQKNPTYFHTLQNLKTFFLVYLLVSSCRPKDLASVILITCSAPRTSPRLRRRLMTRTSHALKSSSSQILRAKRLVLSVRFLKLTVTPFFRLLKVFL